MCQKDKNKSGEGKCRHDVSRRDFFKTMGVATAAILAGQTVNAMDRDAPDETGKQGELSQITLKINGRHQTVLVEPRWSLLYVLREELGFTGTKEGCSRGECGACTVLIDGIAKYACLTLAVEAEGHEITTIEGLLVGEEMGVVQESFYEEDGYQCGYCTPGQIMSAEGLLRKNPEPTLDEIQRGMSGNLCRCGAYVNIFRSVQKAGLQKRGK